MNMRTWLIVLLLGAGVAGCGSSGAPGDSMPPFKQVTDTTQLMNWVLDPAADVVWASVGTIIDADGTHEIVPSTDEEWDAVRNAAITVAEGGNLLMMPAHAQDQGDWMEYAQGMIDAAMLAAKAAQDHSRDGVFDTGGQIYAVCSGCHQMYVESIREGLPR